MCGETGRWCNVCVSCLGVTRRQNAILLVKYIISEAIPDVPAHITEQLARQVRQYDTEQPLTSLLTSGTQRMR